MRGAVGLVAGLALGFLLGFSTRGIFDDPEPGEEAKRPAMQAPESEAPAHPDMRRRKWVHGPVNVRAGRGTSFEVVDRLGPSDQIFADSLEAGWCRVHRGGRPLGYAYNELLLDTPPPRQKLEFHSVQYRVTETNEIWWRFAWILDIENVGLEPLVGMKAELKFLDSGGFVVDTDTERGISLRVGERRSVRGDALIYLPGASNVAELSAEVRR